MPARSKLPSLASTHQRLLAQTTSIRDSFVTWVPRRFRFYDSFSTNPGSRHPTALAGRWYPARITKAGHLLSNLSNLNNRKGDGTPSDKQYLPWSWNTPPPLRESGRLSEWTQHRRPAAPVLQVNQRRLPMHPNEEDRSDTHRLFKSARPCLAGWPPDENATERCLPRLVRWIQAWLVNRQFLVTFKGAKSKNTNRKQGVSHGSILSFQLFLFYIDDLHWDSWDLHVSLFADDVVIWAQDSKLHIVEKRLQLGLARDYME